MYTSFSLDKSSPILWDLPHVLNTGHVEQLKRVKKPAWISCTGTST